MERTSKLRGAVIGVGYLGRFHAQKIKTSPQAELAGVFDFDSSRADVVSAELQVPKFAVLDDVARNVDFVTIAASTQAHFELAEFFLRQNLPTLVEKPIAATADLGARLCEIVDQNGTVFSVGHIERFNPAYRALKDDAFHLSYLELNRLAPFRTRGSDVSVLHDLMIHDIDLIQYIFGKKIVAEMVYGRKMIRETLDEASVMLELETGQKVHIQNSRLTPQVIRNYRAVFNDRVLFMNTATLEGEILYKDFAQDQLHRTEKIIVPRVDALALEIEHFISAVKKEKPVAVTPVEATEALRTVEHFIRKIETGT